MTASDNSSSAVTASASSTDRPVNSKDIVAWLFSFWVIVILYIPGVFQYGPFGLISVLNFLSEPTVIWSSWTIFPLGAWMIRLSWSPKAMYFISPDTKIISPSTYDDLSVLTTTDPSSPNVGVMPILVIKIPNNVKIINWFFIIF